MPLRHRSAESSMIPSTQPLSTSASQARCKVAKSARRIVESLEKRILLTTLHGGDTFIFQNEDGNLEEISLSGNITTELIGANVNGNNQVILQNLPGILNGAGLSRRHRPARWRDPGRQYYDFQSGRTCNHCHAQRPGL